MVDSRQASYNALDLRREEKSFKIALDYCSLALVYLCVAWVVVKHVNVGVSTLPRRRNCCLSNGTPTRYVIQQMRPLFQTPCQRGITTNYNIIVLTSGPYAVNTRAHHHHRLLVSPRNLTHGTYMLFICTHIATKTLRSHLHEVLVCAYICRHY